MEWMEKREEKKGERKEKEKVHRIRIVIIKGNEI